MNKNKLALSIYKKEDEVKGIPIVLDLKEGPSGSIELVTRNKNGGTRLILLTFYADGTVFGHGGLYSSGFNVDEEKGKLVID